MIDTVADAAETAPKTDWTARMEQAVLDAAIVRAPSLGWNSRLVRAACEANGLSLGDEELLLPNGARDLAVLMSRRHDSRSLKALEATPPETMKIRQRIAAAVSARMEAGAQDIEAAKRCAGFLSLPSNIDLGFKLAWESADHLWRWDHLLKLADVQPGDTFWHLLICLRLAALLHRSRSDFLLSDIRISHPDHAYQLEVPRHWLSENRLSAAALVDESLTWRQAGSTLQVIRRAC